MKHCFCILLLFAAAEFFPSMGASGKPDKPTVQQHDLIPALISDAEASADYDDLFSKGKLVVGRAMAFTSQIVP